MKVSWVVKGPMQAYKMAFLQWFVCVQTSTKICTFIRGTAQIHEEAHEGRTTQGSCFVGDMVIVSLR